MIGAAEEEEDDGIPLWKKALMKKRAADQKKKVTELERKVGRLIMHVGNNPECLCWQAEAEKEKWKNVPAWKRAVLEKREAQKYSYKYQ